MFVKVFPQHDLKVSTSVGFILCFHIMSKHFKMYTTINNVIGEKRINLDSPIEGKEIAVISMFSNNVHYWISEHVKVLLIMENKKELLVGPFTGREQRVSLGGKLTTIPLVCKGNIDKTSKLVRVMEVVISLDELDNTDKLEDGTLSKVLLRHHVTDSDEFTRFEPVAPQYKKHKNREFASLTLSIMDRKGNGINDGSRMTIPLHIT